VAVARLGAHCSFAARRPASDFFISSEEMDAVSQQFSRAADHQEVPPSDCRVRNGQARIVEHTTEIREQSPVQRSDFHAHACHVPIKARLSFRNGKQPSPALLPKALYPPAVRCGRRRAPTVASMENVTPATPANRAADNVQLSKPRNRSGYRVGHCSGSWRRGGRGPCLVSISASWTCASIWPKVAHVEPLAAARAFHEVIGLGLGDAVGIVALHDRTFLLVLDGQSRRPGSYVTLSA
jgi:hypothetical protein